MLQEVIGCAELRDSEEKGDDFYDAKDPKQLPSPIGFRFSDFDNRCFSYKKGRVVAIVRAPYYDFKFWMEADLEEYLVSY